MAYYFMVEKTQGEYQPLDISNATGFKVKLKYVKSCAYTLQEIDMFTMMFNNEEELRKFLVTDGILDIDLVNKPLSCRWITKKKYTKVPYDFLYQKDMKYVMDSSKLIELIENRYYYGDFAFIKKFANYFSGYYECSATATEVRMYADMAIKYNTGNRYLSETDKNGDNQVKRLVKLLLIEHDERSDGYIVYKDKINYRNLHTIIAFINNYDKKQGVYTKISEIVPEKSETKISEEQINNNVFSERKNLELVWDTPKVRKRKKRNDDLPGQLSFMDMLNDK